jgi:hypothetical protein
MSLHLRSKFVVAGLALGGAALAAGLALFGSRSLWLSYESFAINGLPIVQTVAQAMAELRRKTPSVINMFTAGALEQGRNLQVKPYVVGSDSRGAQVPSAAAGTAGDAGIDLKYGVTPAMTLDLTLNTDFSQVEVDQEGKEALKIKKIIYS